MNLFSEYQTGTIDLLLDFYGYEDCPPGYSFGPAIRNNFVLHYISQGRGRFHCQGQVVDLAAGDFFLLKPNITTFYEADTDEPWSYYWLGISGSKSEDYFQASRIYDEGFLKVDTLEHAQLLSELIQTIIREAEQLSFNTVNRLSLLSQLYQLLSQLGKIAPRPQNDEMHPTYQLYLAAKRIMENRYMNPQLTVESLAQTLNVHRSYLTTVFNTYNSYGPKAFLQHIRMERARQLLIETQEPIKIIAYSTGFSDPLYFSKVFHRFFQQTPKAFRKNFRRKDDEDI